MHSAFNSDSYLGEVLFIQFLELKFLTFYIVIILCIYYISNTKYLKRIAKFNDRCFYFLPCEKNARLKCPRNFSHLYSSDCFEFFLEMLSCLFLFW